MTFRTELGLDSPSASNMAIDEEMMSSDCPCLRAYTWDPPAISLGLSQDESVLDRVACEEEGIAVVKRFTGGAAVLHKDDVTYSFFYPRRFLSPELPEAVSARQIRARFRTVFLGMFETLGIPAEASEEAGWVMPESAVCFHAPAENEILVAGRKIVGSAQSARRSGVFQHGSIVLKSHEGLLCDLIPGAQSKEAMAGIWEFCPGVRVERIYELLVEQVKDVFGF